MYPRRFERACGKQETSEISNLARKDLLANTAFHSEDTSGITFPLVSLMPVGGSNTKRFEKWWGSTSLLDARKGDMVIKKLLNRPSHYLGTFLRIPKFKVIGTCSSLIS